MSDANSHSRRIIGWFKTHVRPIFQKTEAAPVLEELDKLAGQVEELERNKGRLFPICLLGQAGVGKSTLINTLIADTEIVVPSGGGTGPLTANALRVIYGERRAFAVRYHSEKQVNQTRFILEGEIYRQSKNKAALPDAAGDAAGALESSEILEIELDSEEQKKTRIDEAIGRACLLVAGAQTARRELTYLVDALRWILNQDSKFQTEILEEDLTRLREVQEALKHATKETARHFDSADNPDFGYRLRDHACGFLAPLIVEMTIHWPSPVLRDSLELKTLSVAWIIGKSSLSLIR